ncbi:hypothetical protein B0H14DRAFT_2576184 [Mycena olivaceomarginata]|nr:hypothetical protein B0H14DRAFT_2576184 [Mycena olivaceomarginata]
MPAHSSPKVQRRVTRRPSFSAENGPTQFYNALTAVYGGALTHVMSYTKYAPPVSAPSSRRSSSSPRRGFYKFVAEIFTSCVALLSSLLGSNHVGRIDRSVESQLHKVRPGRWRAKRLWGGSVQTLGLCVMPLWGLEAKSCEGGEWVAPPIVHHASLQRTPGEDEEYHGVEGLEMEASVVPAGTHFSAGGNVFLSGAPGAQIDSTCRVWRGIEAHPYYNLAHVDPWNTRGYLDPRIRITHGKKPVQIRV